jgi:hypothetical protein
VEAIMGKVKEHFHDQIVMDQKLEEIKEQFALYIRSEGCSCCRDDIPHKEAEDRLGELLGFPRYKDDSGYNFSEDKGEKS